MSGTHVPVTIVADMKIATVGRGNIGGGLGELWAKAGHEVTAIGRGGGDVSGADVVLIAVPGRAVDEALVVFGRGTTKGRQTEPHRPSLTTIEPA